MLRKLSANRGVGLTLAAVLAATMLVGDAPAAGPVLVIDDSGYQIMSKGADGKAQLEPVSRVVDLRNDPTPPPGEDPPPPSDDKLVELIATLSKTTIKDKGVANAVAQVLDAVVLNSSDFKLAMDTGLPILAGSLGSLEAKKQVDDWYAAVQKLDSWSFTKANVQKAIDGLARAFDLNKGSLKAISKAVKAEDPVAAAQEAFPEMSAIDLAKIIAIITAIIEVLKNLGIFTGLVLAA